MSIAKPRSLSSCFAISPEHKIWEGDKLLAEPIYHFGYQE